jgi:hypothetical protein
MIVDNFDAVGAGLRPNETDAPLVTRMLYCPALSALNASSRLPGGDRNAGKVGAASSMSSLRASAFGMARH